MDTRVTIIKNQIKNGSYDWDKAIETTAEKLTLLYTLGMYPEESKCKKSVKQ